MRSIKTLPRDGKRLPLGGNVYHWRGTLPLVLGHPGHSLRKEDFQCKVILDGLTKILS